MPLLLLSQMASPCYIKRACLQTEAASVETKIRFDLKNQYDPSRPFQRQHIQLMCRGQAFQMRALAFRGFTVNMEQQAISLKSDGLSFE